MNQNWRTMTRLLAAIVLVLSLSTVIIHAHYDLRGQDCGLCNVQQMPGLQAECGDLLAVPAREQQVLSIAETATRHGEFVRVRFGRAPPKHSF